MIYWSYFNKRKLNTDTIICLDTESTSFWKHEGKFLKWDKTKTDHFWNEECERGSVCYIWQVGIDNEVYYGRELQELEDFLHILEDCAELKEKEKLYIFVHNLAWDFQVCLLNLHLEIEDLFARQVRKPMKFTAGIFEFRCSYQLEHLNLDSWGKQLGIKKLKGDLDYNMLRTPLTPLFDYELEYCEHDILIMLAGLKKEKEKYKHIKNIPLTSTGKVRKVVKKKLHTYAYHKRITKMLPKDKETYLVEHSVSNGGDTHANSKHVGKVLYNALSEDICSSYPYYMCVGNVPISDFAITNEKEENFQYKRFCYIFLIELNNIKSKTSLSYIASSRTVSINNAVYDNGRIAEAEKVVMYCTEYDLHDIKRTYDIESYNFITVRKALKGYLPKEYIEYVLELFHDKSTLKGIEGMADLYMQQKAFLNALFGMMMTDLIMTEVKYEQDSNYWNVKKQYEINFQEKLNEKQEKFFKNFLNYAWGAWITSGCRHELWNAILSLDAEDVIYYDTDSIKYLNAEKYVDVFQELNAKKWDKILKTCKRLQLDPEQFTYINEDPKIGKSHLGAWEYDGSYKELVTLGAKKYCYRDEEDELHITVSGVPKQGVKCLKNDINNFKTGFVFDADTCKKGLATYLEPEGVPNITGQLWDGYVSTQQYGCNLRNCGYTLGLSSDFESFLQNMIDWGNI